MRGFVALAVAAAALGPSLPPAPSTWPQYPHFPAASCWARPSPGGGSVLRSAPSYLAHPAHRAPQAIVRDLLARLGDRRFVERIELGPVPPITRQHTGWFGTAHPPRNALWAYVADPLADVRFGAKPPAAAVQRSGIAEWEGDLVVGALRDAFCANGGPPLAGWTMSGSIRGVSDAGQALGQRFPSPNAAAFRSRLDAVARRYGFSVVSVRLLRAPQLAPLVVVRTGRDAKSFVGDVRKIMQLLDPRRDSAVTFQGFYFEALNAHGPFVSVDDVYRGEVMGGQWSSNPCLYPYVHGGMLGQRC
jgi:predicted lipid carrier protein YhbT